MSNHNRNDDLEPVARESIAAVQNEQDFIDFLRRELSWPIPIKIQRLEDVAIPHDLQKDFGFSPDEDRISVSRLLNLTEDQPWGIFLFEFKTKRPYLSHLRRLMRALSSKRSLQKGDPIWDQNDLLFICTSDWKSYQFLHFSGEKPESAVISTFGWSGPDDPFLYTLCKYNLARLRMPEPDPSNGYDPEKWRQYWRDAFSIRPVTDEFYKTLKEVFDAVQSGVEGIEGEERRFLAELIVNRMVFLKFVEKKGWLNNDTNYLYNRFQDYGKKNFWQDFLSDFFFEGLCKEKAERSDKAISLLGEVPFLNAELFAPAIWSDGSSERDVDIENRVFDILFEKLLNPFNFTVTETSPLDVEVAFNQDLLGYGYEELIADQHGQGAYYTHPTEVNLMCRESLRPYLESRCPNVDRDFIGRLVYTELSPDYEIDNKDALSLYKALHDVTIVDPALGSGTFPVAMMKHLYFTLQSLGEYLEDSPEYKLNIEQGYLTDHRNSFSLKLHIIEQSLYGCDIDYFAVQIAKLRFWIELMVECEKPEALPNFDCKLVVGDALVSVVGKDKRGNIIALEDLLGHPTRTEGQLNFGSAVADELSELKKEYFKVRDNKRREKLKQAIDQKRHELLSIIGVDLDTIEITDKYVLWQVDFAEIFEGDQPGFDIAIANPPYLRSENIDAKFKSLIHKIYSKIFSDLEISKKCDIYVYFYLRASMLCNSFGIVCFICSNSWLDIGYGKVLQQFFLTSTKIVGVYDSAVQRSFAKADINTAITIFQNKNMSEAALDEMAKFVCLYIDLTDINHETMQDIVKSQKTHETEIYKLSLIQQKKAFADGSLDSEKYLGDKWGGRFLRAPVFYQKLIEDNRDKLVRLADICEVYGYIHDNNTGASFPETLFLKSVKDVKTIWINKESDGVINYGVKENGNSRMTAPILFPRTFGTRHAIVWNPEGILGKEFYKIIPNEGMEVMVISQLISTFCILQRELIGVTNLGDGALKFSSSDIGKFWLIKNLYSDDLESAFERIAKRNIHNLSEELKQKDRKMLDNYIFNAIGLSEEKQLEIYKAVEILVKNRIVKANTK